GLGVHLSGRSRQPLLCRSLSSGNARFVFGNEEWRLPPPTPAQTSRGICALRTRAIVANLLRTPRTARGLGSLCQHSAPALSARRAQRALRYWTERFRRGPPVSSPHRAAYDATYGTATF